MKLGDADRWYRILQEQQVTVWYTAPTAICMLMKAGKEIAQKYKFPKLRFIASVGGALNPGGLVGRGSARPAMEATGGRRKPAASPVAQHASVRHQARINGATSAWHRCLYR